MGQTPDLRYTPRTVPLAVLYTHLQTAIRNSTGLFSGRASVVRALVCAGAVGAIPLNL